MTKPFKIGRKVEKSLHFYEGDRVVAVVKVNEIYISHYDTRENSVQLEIVRGSRKTYARFSTKKCFFIEDMNNNPTTEVIINNIDFNQVTFVLTAPSHIKVTRTEKIK